MDRTTTVYLKIQLEICPQFIYPVIEMPLSNILLNYNTLRFLLNFKPAEKHLKIS